MQPLSFCENNSQLIDKWWNDCIKFGKESHESNKKVDNIANIVDRAARELKKLILYATKIYKPHWLAMTPKMTCPIVKHFIEEILPYRRLCLETTS